MKKILSDTQSKLAKLNNIKGEDHLKPLAESVAQTIRNTITMNEYKKMAKSKLADEAASMAAAALATNVPPRAKRVKPFQSAPNNISVNFNCDEDDDDDFQLIADHVNINQSNE